MHIAHHWLTVSLHRVLPFLILCALFGCRELPKEEMPPVQVTTITVKKQDVPAVLEYVGVANSSHLVEIRARVEGYLQKIAYKEGEMVQAGDLLFQIDPKPFEAILAQNKAIQEQQEAVLWQAERALERLTPLYEQKAASKRDLDNATAQVMAAKASVDAAKAQVLQAEINLGYTTIRSPIKAMSNQAKFREGALVGPGSEQSLLTTLYVLDPIWVDFYVSEGDILKYFRESQEGRFKFPAEMNFDIEVVLSDGSTLPSKGKVDFANPVFQENTGSMDVRAVLPNTNDILCPGQFVRTRLLGANFPNAVIIPQSAVLQGKKNLFVYVVDKDNKAEMRDVKVGASYQNGFVIPDGLQEGEVVVIGGVNKILPGEKVVIKDKGGQ